MPELIDKQETLKKECETCGYCERLENAMRSTHPDFVTDKCNSYKFLAEQPTVEAEPVRHGRWIPYFSDEAYNVTNVFICSECEKSVRFIMAYHECEYGFCPHCGARMDGGADNV